MKIKQILLLVAILISSFGCTIYADSGNKLNELAVQAISDNSARSKEAIKELRELGKPGLETLFENYAADIENFKKTGNSTKRWRKIANALDSVAMQKDVYASKLFWNNDLEKAKAESQRTNKPILSLRLLGNLNEELSCANSRFFRSLLYPNASISNYLQENYILHWKSERPAPKITIDFGDGRKIERTITGNSIHYILDADGTVIEALSGLNSPQIFLEFLTTGKAIARNIPDTQIAIAARNSSLTQYRGNKHRGLVTQVDRFGKQLKLQFDRSRDAVRNYEEMPPAITAMGLATTKMIVEMPNLKGITADMTRYGEEQINLENWKQIAKLGKKEAKLDENSIAFIRRQTASNNFSEAEFLALISKLEEYVSIDTARNEFLLRPTLLVWLAKNEGNNFENFNTKVYSQLFLTPKSDKWLGLYAPDIYSALDGNGIK